MHIAALAALLVLLAGCQPLPRPFADEGNDRLLAMPDSYGIVVAEIPDLPPKVAEELRGAVVKALQRAEILASTGPGNRGSYLLTADVLAPPQGASRRAELDWMVQDGDGTIVETFRTAATLRPDHVATDNPALLRSVAQRVAQAIQAGGLAYQTARSAPPPPGLQISVVPVEGAPGDGEEALTQALRESLRAQGLQVAQGVADGDGVLVYGDVEVSPAGQGQERVAIDWVVRWPDGREIGKVSQANVIKAGLLTPKWGDIAVAAAEGAASGIATLVAKLPADEKP